ncbi:hypothetical protein FACS1894217_08160 [Clostridia bacterium]|nr:hypothetical protein FACS1894217_08160 [Clostridia bacterium]
MYRFLSYHNYQNYTAPELDATGAIIRYRDGSPVYSTVGRKECYRIAALLGNGNMYAVPWSYDIDYGTNGGSLILLDPFDPQSKKLANWNGESQKDWQSLIGEDRQCLAFGDCDKEFDLCYDCTKYGTDACSNCKKRCEFCTRKVGSSICAR